MTGPSLGIIGAGKVGSVLARLLYNTGYSVRAVYSRTDNHAYQLAKKVSAQAVARPETVLENADLTLLTVPDDAIKTISDALNVTLLEGKGVIHTSGAHDSKDLSALAQKGAMVGSLHPAFPFADVETVSLADVTFAVEAQDSQLKNWLYGIVAALNGHVMDIPAGQKVTYHLALALASNFTVTLYAAAEELLISLGADRKIADSTLNGLLTGTLENLRQVGIPDSLTGPLPRGDIGTISAHLRVIHDTPLAQVYKGLARLSYPMLKARGVSTTLIEQLFEQDDSYATDNS